jgi:hypothetical protein
LVGADVADFVAAIVFLPASTAGAAGSRHRSSWEQHQPGKGSLTALDAKLWMKPVLGSPVHSRPGLGRVELVDPLLRVGVTFGIGKCRRDEPLPCIVAATRGK